MSWRDAIALAIWPFLLSRLWCAIFVYLGHTQRPYLSPIPGGWEGVANWWLNPWTTYDSKHFLDIAANGYNAQNAAFFPLYPYLLKLAGSNPIEAAAWGVFISNLAFLGALAVFYRLTEREYSARIAKIATWLLAFFPTSAIFSMVYTESVFLFFVVSAFWYLRGHKWAGGAALAFLASLTRNLGPLLFLALAAEWWSQKKAENKCEAVAKPDSKVSIWPVFAPLIGFFAVQLLLQQQTGIWLASIAGQQYFGAGSRHATWPWVPLIHDIMLLFSPGGLNMIYLLSIATCFLTFILLARHYKIQPLSYSVFLLGVLMMHLIYTTGRDAKTVDVLRYMSTTFPFTQLLAIDLQVVGANKMRLMTGIILLLIVSAFFSYSLGLKAYVS